MRRGHPRREVLSILPGVLACAVIGCIAFAASRVQSAILISPVLLAMIFGVVVRNAFGRPEVLKAGVGLAQKRLLRFAIMLLGLQITVGQLTEIGLTGLLIVSVTQVATYSSPSGWTGDRRQTWSCQPDRSRDFGLRRLRRGRGGHRRAGTGRGRHLRRRLRHHFRRSDNGWRCR